MPKRPCSVLGCEAVEQEPGLTCHRLPRDEALRRAWLHCIGLEATNCDKRVVLVCSRHFAPEDYALDPRLLHQMGSALKSSLNPGAIPTLFVPNKPLRPKPQPKPQPQPTEAPQTLETCTHLQVPLMCAVSTQTMQEEHRPPETSLACTQTPKCTQVHRSASTQTMQDECSLAWAAVAGTQTAIARRTVDTQTYCLKDPKKKVGGGTRVSKTLSVKQQTVGAGASGWARGYSSDSSCAWHSAPGIECTPAGAALLTPNEPVLSRDANDGDMSCDDPWEWDPWQSQEEAPVPSQSSTAVVKCEVEGTDIATSLAPVSTEVSYCCEKAAPSICSSRSQKDTLKHKTNVRLSAILKEGKLRRMEHLLRMKLMRQEHRYRMEERKAAHMLQMETLKAKGAFLELKLKALKKQYQDS